MEDSYTVHRRRKAAARKREKTPEPPRRNQEDVAATDDEEETRARMERLVQETERLEELEESARQRAECDKSGEPEARRVAEKPDRSLKRAMSPEVRRREEVVEAEAGKDEPEAKLEVLTLGIDTVRSSSDQRTTEMKGSRAAKRTSEPEVAEERPRDVDAEASRRPKKEEVTGGSSRARSERRRPEVDNDLSPEVAEERPRDVDAEASRRPKKEETTGGSSRARHERRRPEVDNDLSPEAAEKPARSLRKAMSPEIEKRRSDAAVDERRGDAAGADRARKTPSRTSDREDDEAAAASDKNRRSAASSVTRESDAGAPRAASERNDNVKIQERKRDAEETKRSARSRETDERSSTRITDENLKSRKREVTSPAKARSSESRVASSTTKRTTKERDLERTGYTTDSSETEEIARRAPRRRKSPEDGRARTSGSRKTPSRSRLDDETNVDEPEKSWRTEKRSASRRGHASDSDEDRRDSAARVTSRQAEKSRTAEKRPSGSRSRHPSDTEDDRRVGVRKSGSFPVEQPRDRSPSIARSASDVKKQIIPLSDDSLIEDFERAQREYMRRERGILDYDPMDDYVDPTMEAALRRRKFSIVQPEVEMKGVVEEQPVQAKKRSWFGWIPFFGRKATKEKLDEEEIKPEVEPEKPKKRIEAEFEEPQAPTEDPPKRKRVSFMEFFRTLADFLSEFRAFVEQNPNETRCIRLLRNRCLVELLLAVIYCGLGAFVFRFTEGAFETFYKCGVKRVKRDFLDSLWNFSHNMREEDWKSMARRKLMEFEEQLHTAHEAGVHSYSGQKSWSFLNAVVYCLTVITTIGYGHISPSTTTGRAITIVYAIFGIPMFLIILADFGKLFTRGIKFLWAFVRRVYYTGSCRRVRRTVPVQEVMKGVQLVYDLATFRRPSQMNPEEIQEMQKQQSQTQTVLNLDGSAPPSATVPPDTPGTPAMSTFAIDDEFNLPISVAIFILLVYIFVGATVYNFWEEWGFFESFYFVFISMSTIGFGDYVPKHPIYMMLSIVYLVFGLALTSMCINVVQVMLSDSFKQASQKIGATIGFEVAEDDGSAEPAAPDPVEVADVHPTIKESESKEQIAPKAKQENVDL